jgi:hypothetical protein
VFVDGDEKIAFVDLSRKGCFPPKVKPAHANWQMQHVVQKVAGMQVRGVTMIYRCCPSTKLVAFKISGRRVTD